MRRLWPTLLLIAAGLAAYGNSFHGSFQSDDFGSIVDNPLIRRLDRPAAYLWGLPHQRGTTVEGRPLLSLTFALNRAACGLNPFGYHVVNLAIHLVAAILLFGLVRRTLLRPPLRDRFGPGAQAIAAAAALIWELHPLQTESVAYLAQRAESLMGLCLFACLYCFARSLDSGRPRFWRWACVGACLAAVGTKESAAVAPVLVLLYDRAFGAGSLRKCGAQRQRFYAALFGTWIPLGILILHTGGNRGGSVGLGTAADAPAYWLSQFRATALYLRLAFWPRGLVFDRGPVPAADWVGSLPWVAAISAFAVVAAWIAVRRPAAGFAGAAFMLALLPASVAPGVAQFAVEHRMYVPLAALAGGGVAAAWLAWGRKAVAVAFCLAAVLGILTFARNRVYAAPIALWSDVVAKRPSSAVAHDDLGGALVAQGRYGEAMIEFGRAIELDPAYAVGFCNRGNLEARIGQLGLARADYDRAIRLRPGLAAAWSGLGAVQFFEGDLTGARESFARALSLDGCNSSLWLNQANLLMRSGLVADALQSYRKACELDPDSPRTHNELGVALCRAGRVEEGAAEFRAALDCDPGFGEARSNLSRVAH